MVVSLGSFLKTSPSVERDLAIESREEVFAEAVYYYHILLVCVMILFLVSFGVWCRSATQLSPASDDLPDWIEGGHTNALA